ncbi:hypothetical protein ACFWBX_16985 [Streptomyces sp. NPDC059991]|uniref:hypothetical protein n=1 Tax=Streptomyces sp. NPDC059991 TaxID=3347028 RepID=UPI0036800166
MTYLGLRRARQSSDAEAFGPAVLFLDLVHPDRVSLNVSPDQETEAAKWAALSQQAQTARERLLVVSAGHPRRRVRELAQEAQVKLANAHQASGRQASDVAKHEGDPEWRAHALKAYAEADAAMRKLINAHFKWFGRS